MLTMKQMSLVPKMPIRLFLSSTARPPHHVEGIRTSHANLFSFRHLRLLRPDHPRRRHPLHFRRGAKIPRLHARLLRWRSRRHLLVPTSDRRAQAEARPFLRDQSSPTKYPLPHPGHPRRCRKATPIRRVHRRLEHPGILLGRQNRVPGRRQG